MTSPSGSAWTRTVAHSENEIVAAVLTGPRQDVCTRSAHQPPCEPPQRRCSLKVADRQHDPVYSEELGFYNHRGTAAQLRDLVGGGEYGSIDTG